MKKLTVLVALLLVCAFSMTSCSLYQSLLYTMRYSEEQQTTEADTTAKKPQSDQTNDKTDAPATNQTPTEVYQTVINNQITINGTADSSIAQAAASGLRSAVSVYCFYKTSGSFLSPSQSYYSTGSGVIYRLENDGSAFVITNYHVVYDDDSTTANKISDQIELYLYGMENEEYAIPATYVGGSANYDLAVLHVSASSVLRAAMATGSVAAVTVGNSDLLVPGDTTIAIGNPSSSEANLGGISVTRGIVSVDSEYITMTASDNSGQVQFRVIRTDTAVNTGNSGGGLYNDVGELIGIVNAKTAVSNMENVGYALPSCVVRAVADNIIDYCYGKDCESVMRVLMGVTVKVTAQSTVYDTESGKVYCCEEVSVYELTDGGLAKNVLKVGDVIRSVTVDGKKTTVERQYQLIDAMLDARVGDTVTLEIERDGIAKNLQITITSACLTAY